MPTTGPGEGVWGTLVWGPCQTSPELHHAHGYITTWQLGDSVLVQVESPAVDVLPHKIRVFPLPAICHIELLDSEDEVRKALAADAIHPEARLAHEMDEQRQALAERRVLSHSREKDTHPLQPAGFALPPPSTP